MIRYYRVHDTESQIPLTDWMGEKAIGDWIEMFAELNGWEATEPLVIVCADDWPRTDE